MPFLPVTRDSYSDTQRSYTCLDAAPDPWGTCFCFPAGWLWGGQMVARDGKKCPVGIFPSWKDGKESPCRPAYTGSEQLRRHRWDPHQQSGTPGTHCQQVFADTEPDGSAIARMLSLSNAQQAALRKGKNGRKGKLEASRKKKKQCRAVVALLILRPTRISTPITQISDFSSSLGQCDAMGQSVVRCAVLDCHQPGCFRGKR